MFTVKIRRPARILVMTGILFTALACGIRASKADSMSAEILAGRLHPGIVLDVSPPNESNPVKWQYNAAQLDSIVAAGFHSIRIYVVAMQEPSVYKNIIDDALERGLVVMISLWGNSTWMSDHDDGLLDFVRVWKNYADFYKDYPPELIFDLLNEPSAILVEQGKPTGIDQPEKVMHYLNAVIPVIRKSNPDRVLGIGSPGLNGAKELMQYVTPQYMDYKLEDGSGFREDSSLMGLFHMYHPGGFTHWTAGLNDFPGWQEEVRNELSFPHNWSVQWNKPAVLSEWGAWAPPKRPVEDYRTYLMYVNEECRKCGIPWIYYGVGFNDQWAFNILSTANGWNQDALDILTRKDATE